MRFLHAPAFSSSSQLQRIYSKEHKSMEATEAPPWGEEVSFTHEQINHNSLQTFLQTMAANLHTKSLRVNGLQCPLTTMSELSTALELNSTLTHLSLSRCGVNDDATCALSQALKPNETLQTLNLHGNDITDRGGVCLVESLEQNPVLTSLTLTRNKLGEQTAEALGNLLRSNTSLRTLGLAHNDISQKGAEAFASGLNENTSLLSLTFDGNNAVSYDTILDLKRCIADNRVATKQAYYNVIKKKKRAQPWFRTKLMVVGEGRSGKTATVRSLLNKPFDPALRSTVGVALSETLAAGKSGWVEQDLQEEFSFTATFAATAIATSRKAVEKRKAKARTGRQKQPSRPPANTPFVAAKPPASFESNYRYKDALFMDAKNRVHLLVWDYGGQEVFHTLHHLFLTSTGVYLLIFSLASYINDPQTTTRHVHFWLNSISLQAPLTPILCAATFAEAVRTPSDVATLEAEFGQLKKEFPQIVAQNDTDIIYTIDNSTRKGLDPLRKAIFETATGGEQFGTKIPVKWVQCLDELLRKPLREWMTTEEVRQKAAGVDITEEQEFQSMLNAFHQYGLLLYFEATEQLKDTVITDPRWLVTLVGRVIRDRVEHPYEMKAVEEAGLLDDLQVFLNTAIASRDLLSMLWGNKKVEYLLDLFRELLLIGDWSFGDEPRFLVPALLTSKADTTQVGAPAAYLRFKFLPNGVFERIVCLMTATSGKDSDAREPELSAQECRIWFGASSSLFIQRGSNDIVLQADPPTKSKEFLQAITFALGKIRREVFRSSVGFEWEVFVAHEGGELALVDAVQRKIKPWSDETVSATTNAHVQEYLSS